MRPVAKTLTVFSSVENAAIIKAHDNAAKLCFLFATIEIFTSIDDHFEVLVAVIVSEKIFDQILLINRDISLLMNDGIEKQWFATLRQIANMTNVNTMRY